MAKGVRISIDANEMHRLNDTPKIVYHSTAVGRLRLH